MPGHGVNAGSAGQKSYRYPIIYPRRESGKSIRRRIKRRFDAVLKEIAGSDPDQILQLPYARWLLDNSHLVYQALQQIETDLPSGYLRQLPTVLTAEGNRIPRIFALTEEAIDQSGLPIDCGSIQCFCRDCQSVAVADTRLTLGELWAVPTALRVTLLTRLCVAAEFCQKENGQGLDLIEGESGVTVVAGCITSLRTVATLNWQEFVEQASTVEHVLRTDPSGFYPRMDFATRDRYRGLIEHIARRTGSEQWEIAQAAVRLAQQAQRDQQSAHRQHVGYYLIDNGRQQLEQAVNYRPALVERAKRCLGKHRAALYLLAIVGFAVTGSVALMTGLLADNAAAAVSIAAAVIALIPLLSVSSGTVNFLVSISVPPRRLPKLDFTAGIPADQQSIIVVPMLLSTTADIAENLKTLEQNFLGNSDPRLRFALLSDFTDAAAPETPADQPLLNQALAGIDSLNRRYAANGAGPFLLFHRKRLWNGDAGRWMGWERKRGKLEEFNKLMRGAADTSYVLQHGDDLNDFQQIRYVITLDADSYMPTGTAARLVGTMAHPLNLARFDDHTQRVAGGYTVIQPRLETNPVTGADTLFARIFAGDVMLDLYSHAVSNVYQDLFGDAVYAGKGIYDLDAFRRSADGRIPDNTVLSHDLLEGLLGRAGLASDIVILENYPSNYLVYLQRLHRWVRGDWQLLPWLSTAMTTGGRKFKPGGIGYWKLFDNLRRSLVTPAILLLLVLGWIWLPGNPVAWTLVFALFPGLPILLRLTLALRTSLWRWGTIESSLRNLAGYAGADMGRWLLALVFLPAEAYVVADAILRTIYRVICSRRSLLQWATAAQVSRTMGKSSRASNFWRRLWFGPATAVAAGLLVFMFNSQSLPAASALLFLWFFSPLIALRLGRHIEERPPVQLSPPDALLLRGVARDTWRFFERFVGPDSSWLPPDNVQEFPHRTIAERTSPTNIGMLLLATLTAYDLGYLGPRQLLARLAKHVESIQRMQKHRGHLFNWCSIRDLQPLQPLYVSTVDSGNFVAALIVVRQALEELPHDVHMFDRAVPGLADELLALRRQLFADESTFTDSATQQLLTTLDAAQAVLSEPQDLMTAIHRFEHQHYGEIEREFLHALRQNPHRWSAEQISSFRENSQTFRQHIRAILADIEVFAPWSEQLMVAPAFFRGHQFNKRFEQMAEVLGVMRNAANLEQRLEAGEQWAADLAIRLSRSGSNDPVEREASAWLEALQRNIANAQEALRAQDQSRRELIRAIAALIENTDFGFLYDLNRNLFRVGYNASIGEADSSYYDLLASEARIASFVAIAKGNIQAKHWMHLGRPLTRIRGLRILLSWSATAFEYLMPRLIMHSPMSGLINQSCAGAVREQIRFGRENRIPWGVSESGYAQFDAQGQYQYHAFGIPRLGLKWDQGERLVVSPYSSLLALPYAPAATVSNLQRLIGLKAYGRFGLYEALDFGEAHNPRPARPRVVQSYMAHHQGMILVAIGNAINRDQILHRFHRDPRIASVEHLLYERLPQRIQTRPLGRLPSPLKELLPGAPATITQWQVEPDDPELAILSNGHLSSRVSDQGGGALYWRGMAITRWEPLSQGPTSGTCVYFKDVDKQRLWSLGCEPLQEDVEVFFAPHIVEFRMRREEMLMRMTVTVAPAEDVEIRRVTVTNDRAKSRRVMLAFYSEPVLAKENADRRHRAFSKLFVESRLSEDGKIVLFKRRPREPDQSPVYLVQTAVTSPGCEVSRRFEIDRGAFLGRGGDPARPVALTDPIYQFKDTARANLDPCAAIVLTLRVPPRSTVQCAFLSSVADTRVAAADALQSFQSPERIGWAIEAARLQSERELTGLRVNSEHVRASFRMMSRVFWPRTLPHLGSNAFDDVSHVQDSLWRRGISGDRPVITQRIDGDEDLGPAENLLKSISYLSRKDFALDAIFLDETESGYLSPVNDRLRKLVETTLAASREHNGSSAFILPARNLPAGERSNLIAAARWFIDTHTRAAVSRLEMANHVIRMPAFIPQPSSPLSEEDIRPVGRHAGLQFENALGGMLPALDGYALLLANESRTPAPWCNILANPDFGTLVSESGSMCTWWGNSSEQRLSPWNNDPVLDRTGEAIYARDEETGTSWSLTPQPRPDGPPYRVTHAIGQTVFEHNSQGLEQRLQVFVDSEEPVKVLRLRLANKWPRDRRLTVTFAVEWLLGNSQDFHGHLLLPERDSHTGALLVRNAYIRHGDGELAFVASSLPAHGVCCDGAEFFGKRHSWLAPAALTAVGLSDRVEPCAQACAVYQVHIDLPTDETREFHFVLGAAGKLQAARELITRSCKPDWIEQRYQALAQHWGRLLGAWRVRTPDLAADAMINQWLLYQVISSRMWGRTGFYQSSGGFGFRDQLQDALALLDAEPEMARQHIVLAASRQFEEGDVLHWWHEAPLRGVRSRCSDDLLWLAYAVSEYVDVTADPSILRDTAAFLQGEPLRENELERYAEYQAAAHAASIYDHCCRALDARILFGAHGMPFIGTGDWNDGMNRVGEKGQGESVWMAWFLVVICRRFAHLCRQMGDGPRADHYQSIAAGLLQRTKETAWAGGWYLRGYFDDGTPLGAPGDIEAEIDLNAQTWAAFADPYDPHAFSAMQAVEEKLVDTKHRLIKLLAPPFDKTTQDPGYIKAYPPGVRENGGQYTHAAVWAAWAAVELGDKNNAMRWFQWLNPLNRARSDEDLQIYRLEPYVTAGDIYGVGALAGRGGWSWYTGSAAWLYCFALRKLLGLQRRGDQLFVRPCLPASWPGFQATLRYQDAEHELNVHDPGDIRQDKLFMVKDGLVVDAPSIDLAAGGRHVCEIFASAAARRIWLERQ